MMKLAGEHEDLTLRVWLLITGRCAYDAETGIYLTRSRGSRRCCRPARYYLGGVDWKGVSNWPEPPAYWKRLLSDDVRWPRFTAYGDAEAVLKATAWIERAVAAV
jgi:hypothetical protein